MPSIYDRTSKSHHIGDPRTHFTNPWPSFKQAGLMQALGTRFGRNRNFVPVPENREGLVKIRKPDWGAVEDPRSEALKATWIGHASWLVETGTSAPAIQETPVDERNYLAVNGTEESGTGRGVRVLFDPVFSERTSPVKFIGPKRYTPTPCSIADLPDVDLVCISHNHYDHLDLDSIRELHAKSRKTRFFCPLGIKDWFVSIGIAEDLVKELDWWEGASLSTPESDTTVNLVCTPAQHMSARSVGDQGKTLWCSWVLGETSVSGIEEAPSMPVMHDSIVKNLALFPSGPLQEIVGYRRLFFAGDTGYRHVDEAKPTHEEEASMPRCPAFVEIGAALGPFDLALLPIGLYTPRDFMSSVHCAPEDSVCVHKDVRSKRSIGMHYGTVRGGLSAHYEEVTEPPRRWEEACKKAGLNWGEEVGLCDIGETVVVK